jgi:hypothetical protein
VPVEKPMPAERWVVALQIAAASLGIPVAAAGGYSAYQAYFATETGCRQLRATIIATMERNVAAEAKRALLHKDIATFLKQCGDSDPDARSVFQAAMHEPEHSVGQAVAAGGTPAPHGTFGVSGAGAHRGWVALSRLEGGGWLVNFSGYAISEAALPPADTILTAQRTLPVWSQPQGASNDQHQYQSRLPAGSCVRVLATRVGPGRLWAEIAPASCS